MKRFTTLLILSLILGCSALAIADQDLYPFSRKADQERFTQLTYQLRCLVCQNETLADSSAPLANDLRNKVYHQVRAGKSNKAIIDYMVSRYGDFVLFDPPIQENTWVLWFAPFIALICGFGIFFLVLKIRRRQLEE